MPDLNPTSEGEIPWTRPKTYRAKYGIGATTFWKWRKAGLVETREVNGCIFVKDALPRDTSSNPK